MKPLLTTLSVLTLVTITGNLNNTLHTTLQKNNISSNSIAAKTNKILFILMKMASNKQLVSMIYQK